MLFRVSHARIHRRFGASLSRYYPTKKRRSGELDKREKQWITFHCTGGVHINPLLQWFSSRKTPGPDGQVRMRGGSTHFTIEHDGTPWSHVRISDSSWHCRGRNRDSLSVELINACNLKMVDGKPHWWAGEYKLPYEPTVVVPAFRGCELWQPFDERQFIALVKLFRVCRYAKPDTFDQSRVCEHYQFSKKRVDCGPLFPREKIVKAIFSDMPVSQIDWIAAFTDSRDPNFDVDHEVNANDLIKLFGFVNDQFFDKKHGGQGNGGVEYVESPEIRMRRIQTALKPLNLYKGKVDGIFGPLTKKGVRHFQVYWNSSEPTDEIVIDGIPGPITCKRLFAEFPA